MASQNLVYAMALLSTMRCDLTQPQCLGTWGVIIAPCWLSAYLVSDNLRRLACYIRQGCLRAGIPEPSHQSTVMEGVINVVRELT